MSNLEQFKGKRALVTGAGSGIGRDLVRRLVSLGMHVVAASQTEAKLASLKQELGEQALTTVCVDLGSWAETEAKLGKHCQQLDYLVNNAGYSHCALVENMPAEQVDRMLDVNVKCPLNLIRLVTPGMKQRRCGCIVNVSSVASLAAVDEHVAYAASKAALDMVTKVCAKELGPYNVRVNSVNPTVVWTEMGKRHWGEPDKKALITSKIPMGRFVEVHEVIEPIIFLLGQESSMVSGITMAIDGGYSAT